MKNIVKLSLVALLTATAIPAMAAKTEPYTNPGTNAREMLVAFITDNKNIHRASMIT